MGCKDMSLTEQAHSSVVLAALNQWILLPGSQLTTPHINGMSHIFK